MQRSFKSRLAELEALEAQHEAERTAGGELPDVATLDDAEVLYEVAYGLRSFALYVDLPGFWLKVSGMVDRVWAPWYERLIARAQPLLDTCEKPIILLDLWEIERTLELIDAGQVEVATQWGAYASLKPSALVDADDADAIAAVNWAADLMLRQVHHPQPRNFREPEFTTLDEWREWLRALEQSYGN